MRREKHHTNRKTEENRKMVMISVISIAPWLGVSLLYREGERGKRDSGSKWIH